MGIFTRRRATPDGAAAGPDDHAGGRPGADGPARQDIAAGHGTSPVRDLNDREFMAATVDGFTIVDFWAPWCGPCRSFHPVYEDIARDRSRPGLRFARMNVDEARVTAQMVGIRSVPTLVVFDPAGNELTRLSGVPPRRVIDDLIDALPTDAGGAP